MWTEDGLDSGSKQLRQKQLAMSYLEMQQLYNPVLQTMMQTGPSDFGHFMAPHDQATDTNGSLLKSRLMNKEDSPQQDDPVVKTETSKPASVVKETKPELKTKIRALPKRLQNSVKTQPSPIKPRVRSKKKVVEKPFQIHDDMTCFVCNIFCGHLDALEEHMKSTKNVCRVCTKTFVLHSELEQHFTTHKPSVCTSCGAVNYCKADYYKHLRENSACNTYETELKCDICDRKFLRKRTLRIHKIQQHTNVEAKLKCVVCEKPFNLTWMLNLHLSKVHFVSEHLECQLCHRIFLGVDSLKNHMNLKHFSGSEPPKSYQCTVCNQDFNKESSLVSHMKHRHDKTESLCEDCGVSVFGYKAMQEHKRMNHPKENEMFICEMCHQTFNDYKSYRQHRKMFHHKKPEPQFCEICGKEFKSSSTLRHHYAVHKDERKWECEICGAAFKQKVALTTHSRVHSDVKQYVCDNCGESFRWKQTFDKHMKICALSNTQGHMIE